MNQFIKYLHSGRAKGSPRRQNKNVIGRKKNKDKEAKVSTNTQCKKASVKKKNHFPLKLAPKPKNQKFK